MKIKPILGNDCFTFYRRSLTNLASCQECVDDVNDDELADDAMVDVIRHPIDPGKTRHNILYDSKA